MSVGTSTFVTTTAVGLVWMVDGAAGDELRLCALKSPLESCSSNVGAPDPEHAGGTTLPGAFPDGCCIAKSGTLNCTWNVTSSPAGTSIVAVQAYVLPNASCPRRDVAVKSICRSTPPPSRVNSPGATEPSLAGGGLPGIHGRKGIFEPFCANSRSCASALIASRSG